jgi:DNA-binding Lrp family transcriptional regulator
VAISEHVSGWTFLSNHAHVILVLARDPDKRMRDIADEVGITERAVQRIIAELLEIGAIDCERVGRRNHYEVNRKLPLRHPLESSHYLGELIDTLSPVEKRRRSSG